MLATAIFIATYHTAARGDDLLACFNPLAAGRIAACTAIIDNPETTPKLRAEALGQRAIANRRRGAYPEAFADYDRALALNPRSPQLLNNRAWAYLKAGRPGEGLPDVEQALTLDPGEPNALDTRAHIHQALGAAAKALADYQSVMRNGGAAWVRRYQCGLMERGLFSGPVDGQPSEALSEAMTRCAARPACDPLPAEEDCQPTGS